MTAPEARKKLEEQVRAKEKELQEAKDSLAQFRRTLPPESVTDYVFEGPWGEPVALSALFGSKNELILIHNMGHACPSCTLWADGFNGILQHVEDRAAFVVESLDDPETQRRFGADRGWRFKMVSSRSNRFRKDMGYLQPDGDPEAGMSVFVKDAAGNIQRVSDSGFGPGDNFCVLWDLIDMLPDSNPKWRNQFRYFKETK